MRKALVISRFAEKLLPEPGVPEDQTVRVFELLAVNHDHVVGERIQPVIQRLAALKKLLRRERTNTAVEEVVSPRSILDLIQANRREDISPSSCWKSSRLSAQLYFWAMEAVWKMAFSSFWREAAVFMMRMVTRNILSLRV